MPEQEGQFSGFSIEGFQEGPEIKKNKAIQLFKGEEMVRNASVAVETIPYLECSRKFMRVARALIGDRAGEARTYVLTMVCATPRNSDQKPFYVATIENGYDVAFQLQGVEAEEFFNLYLPFAKK